MTYLHFMASVFSFIRLKSFLMCWLSSHIMGYLLICLYLERRQKRSWLEDPYIFSGFVHWWVCLRVYRQKATHDWVEAYNARLWSVFPLWDWFTFLRGFFVFLLFVAAAVVFALGENICEKFFWNLTVFESIPALSSVSILTPAYHSTPHLRWSVTSMGLAVWLSLSLGESSSWCCLGFIFLYLL